MLGIPAGMLAAMRRNSIFDHGVMGVSLAGYSMPIFWWGLLLILLFSVQLGLDARLRPHRRASTSSSRSPGFLTIDSLLSGEKGAFASTVSHLILPTIVLGTVPLAVIARMTRSSMLEVLGEDYIRTARAKGLSRLRVVALHAFRNALIPVVTVIGLQVGVLFTGAILTETIFSWPGVGKWMIEAISRRDYPVLQGGVLLLGVMVMSVNLLVDVTYGIINPRIRQGMTRDQRTLAAAPAAAPRAARPAARVLGLFQREPRRRGRARRRRRGDRLMAIFANVIAPYPPDLTNNAVFLKPPAWQAGGSLGVSARHRRHRPRHPLAAHLRRAAVAADRRRGRRDVDRRRHRARPRSPASSAASTEIAIMRLMDIILTLPSLLLAIVIVAILGPGHHERDARRGRGRAAALRAHHARGGDHRNVEGLRHRGARERRDALRLMFSEVLPNCAAPLIVQASLGVSTAILDAAALGFLGLGAQPPASEWGTMLADAREFVLRAWWVVTFPGLMILITVLAFNLLGDGLRDALDPKLKR